MKFARFLICLALIPLAVLAVVGPRYFGDPYLVFNPPQGVIHGNRPNLRYIKHVKLARSCEPGRGYVLGTSRATGYSVHALEDIYGFPFFNYTVPTEEWAGMQFRAQWLMTHCDPGLLVLTLDPLTFNYEPYTDDYLRLEPPTMTGENPVLFKLDYLRAPMSSVLRLDAARDDRFEYDSDTGHWSIPSAEKARAAGRGLKEKQKCVPKRRIRGHKPGRLKPQIGAMKAIKETAETTDTPLMWAVNPLSSTYLNKFDAGFYAGWTDEMLQTTGKLLNLGGFNSFTTDGAHYWEYSHFRFNALGPVLKTAVKSENDTLIGFWTQDHAAQLHAKIEQSFAQHRAACAKNNKGS